MEQRAEPHADNDVVVIGGGIVGCATAYYLARRGLKVTLCDKGRLAWEQSSRNWGFVRKQKRPRVEAPIAVLGHRLWRELPAELEADIEFEAGGGLSLAKREGQLAEFEEALAVARDFGMDTRMVTREEIHRLIPGFAGEFIGGLYTASDGTAHPLKTTLAFAEAAERFGARLVPHCAVEGLLRHDDGRVTGVVTERGEIAGRLVLCAAGIHSRKLARMAGLNLPMRGVRESVAATAPLAPLTRVSVFGEDVCFRQTQAGPCHLSRTNLGSADFDVTLESFRNVRLFLPTFLKHRDIVRVHVGRPLLRDIARAMPWSPARRHPFAHAVDVEPQVNARTVEACRQAFMRHFPHLGDVAIEHTWAGVIDSTPDLLPVLGPARGAEGFWLATGFSGHGFGLGPPAGYLMAEWIAEGRPSIDLGPFRLERFAEGTWRPPGGIG